MTKTTSYEKFRKKWPPLRKKKMSNTRHDIRRNKLHRIPQIQVLFARLRIPGLRN